MIPRRSTSLIAALGALLSAVCGTAFGQAAGTITTPATKGPTFIDAERIDGVGGIEVTARGKAEIRQDDQTIFGDYLKLNRETGFVEGEGGVRMDTATDRMSGTRLRLNRNEQTGTLDEPNFLFRRDQTTRGVAREMEFLGPNRYRLREASYTTCAPGQDDWRFDAEDLVLDYDAEEAHLRNGRLRFFDTTILPVPFGTFPLENRRKSGFLTPRYTQSSLRGLEVTAPYYWNIAPEQDLTLTPVYMQRRGTQLKTDYRYVGQPYRGNAYLEYMPNDAVRDRKRWGLSLLHEQQITSTLAGRVDFNRASDANYFSDLSSQVRYASMRHLIGDASLSYNGTLSGQAVGSALDRAGLPPQEQTYGVTARLQRYQTLQDPLSPVGVPYSRMPQINFSTGRNDVAGLFDIGLPIEYVRFLHPTAVDGGRTVISPSVSLPFAAPGWFVRNRFGLHRASYSLDQVAAGQSRSPSFTVPWFSVDSGLIFERPWDWLGQGYTQTVEPRLFYVLVPYVNQSRAPVFDTGAAEFNFAQIFSENRFSGNDRFGDANHVTAAVTTRILTEKGVEAFRATVGQRYYFSDEKVVINPTDPRRTVSDSDILASVGAKLGGAWTLDTTMQYSPRTDSAERYTISGRYSPEIAKVISASFRYNRNSLRQIDVSGQWPIGTGWYAIGRYNYSFLDRRLIEGVAGLEYNAGCWIFRGVVQRMQASTLLTSTALMLQIEFSGFGQIGSDDLADFLKRRVAGYAPTNPVDPARVPPSLAPRLPFQQVF